MTKYIFLLSFFFLIPLTSHGAEIACTMEYAPVCGQPPMPECPTGMACIQALPSPKTYGNTCMMKADGATLIHEGDCNISQSIAPAVCTKEYNPVCGMIQVQCITTPCDPVRTDFGNLCMAKAAGATDITGGTCIMSESTPPMMGGDRDSHGCIASAGYSWDTSLQSCIRPWEYQPQVDWAYEHKITRYNSLSDFKYGNTLTRQEAAAFITRYLLEGLSRPEALCKLAYKDMENIDTTLIPSISRACGMGVMLGNGGYFYPKMELTRAQAIAILIRAIDQKKLDESVTPWYQGYMDRAYALGLGFANMKGFDAPITRGEFVEWLKVLSEGSIVPNNDSLLLGEWKLERFTDAKGKEYSASGNLLTFTTDRFSIRLCNSISGNYTAKDGTIHTSAVMSTLMACMDEPITMMEGSFDLDGATYAVAMARVLPGYTGSTMWVNFTTKGGASYTFGR